MDRLDGPTATGERDYWEALNRSWQESRPQALWRAHSDRVHIRRFADWLPARPVEALLKTDSFDEAVGPGLYPLLSARARRVVGIDVARQAVAAARQRYPGYVGASADVRRLPFPDDTFDVVVSNSTLDHFEEADDITAALRELYRVLRPTGRLLLTLDNPSNPIVALRNALPFGVIHRLGLVPYRMGRTCGPRRLRGLLSGVGLEVEEVTAILHCPRAPAVAVASVLDRHGGAQARAAYLHALVQFEWLALIPTRFLTGYFIAVKARKTR